MLMDCQVVTDRTVGNAEGCQGIPAIWWGMLMDSPDYTGNMAGNADGLLSYMDRMAGNANGLPGLYRPFGGEC